MRVKLCEEWMGCGGPRAAGRAVQVESSWEGGDGQEDVEKCMASKHPAAWGDGETVTETQRIEQRTRTQNTPETVCRGRPSTSEPIAEVGRFKGQDSAEEKTRLWSLRSCRTILVSDGTILIGSQEPQEQGRCSRCGCGYSACLLSPLA